MGTTEETPEKNVWRELIDKTKLANIAAFILVVGGFLYAYTNSDVKLIESSFLLGVGYLLGKTTTG